MSAKRKLFQDILRVLLGFGIMWLLCALSGGVSDSDLMGCWLASGVVIGWGVASHIITAVGLWSLLIKFVLAIIIGIPATVIVLVKDVIALIAELREPAPEVKTWTANSAEEDTQ